MKDIRLVVSAEDLRTDVIAQIKASVQLVANREWLISELLNPEVHDPAKWRYPLLESMAETLMETIEENGNHLDVRLVEAFAEMVFFAGVVHALSDDRKILAIDVSGEISDVPPCDHDNVQHFPEPGGYL